MGEKKMASASKQESVVGVGHAPLKSNLLGKGIIWDLTSIKFSQVSFSSSGKYWFAFCQSYISRSKKVSNTSVVEELMVDRSVLQFSLLTLEYISDIAFSFEKVLLRVCVLANAQESNAKITIIIPIAVKKNRGFIRTTVGRFYFDLSYPIISDTVQLGIIRTV